MCLSFCHNSFKQFYNHSLIFFYAGKMIQDQATADAEDASMREQLTESIGGKNPLDSIKDLKMIP